MSRLRRNVGLGLSAACVVVFMWPGPSAADTNLGGYSASAQAEPIRVRIYEPVIPIPSTPQVDAGVAFTRSTTDTGPVSRALASYLWPGDTVGDGFSSLVGNPSANYPVQVNSRYPATPTSPAQNTAQLTDGNGMTTSSNTSATKADVTGLGITGTNVASNPLAGLGSLLGAPSSPAAPKLPVPVALPGPLAGLVNVGNLKSDSDLSLGASTITSTAHATMSNVSLLGGLIDIAGVDAVASTTSDGAKASAAGTTTIGGLTVLGQKIALTDKGVELAGQKVPLPGLPNLLGALGITITYLQNSRTVSGPGASLSSSALEISIDTAPLKNMLNVSALTGALATIISKIPNTGQLTALLNIGPRIVLDLGAVRSSATASPQYNGGGFTGGTTGSNTPGTGGTTGASTGGTTGSTGGDMGTTTGMIGATAGTPGTPGTPGIAPLTVQPSALDLPALGSMPRFLILGALIIAAALGWVLRNAAGLLFGGAGNCDFGLATGVPDLRKG